MSADPVDPGADVGQAGTEAGVRAMEAGIRTDFSTTMDYGAYLDLSSLLSAQHPLSRPVHPDELLFVIQHQTTELWFKLVLHELRGVRDHLDQDDPSRASKALARVKHTFRILGDQWAVLATLTPTEYAGFRDALGSSSGFQSYQYRSVEFILGNKNERMPDVVDSQPEVRADLQGLYDSPTVYDAFLRFLARKGHQVPADVLERDVREPWVEVPALSPVIARIYRNIGEHWVEHEICEDLVDLEDAVQFWRFRHLRTVQRTIGFQTGTGGSSGVSFLRRALDLTFFPELYSVRMNTSAEHAPPSVAFGGGPSLRPEDHQGQHHGR